jgi:hypothetical protein
MMDTSGYPIAQTSNEEVQPILLHNKKNTDQYHNATFRFLIHTLFSTSMILTVIAFSFGVGGCSLLGAFSVNIEDPVTKDVWVHRNKLKLYGVFDAVTATMMIASVFTFMMCIYSKRISKLIALDMLVGDEPIGINIVLSFLIIGYYLCMLGLAVACMIVAIRDLSLFQYMNRQMCLIVKDTGESDNAACNHVKKGFEFLIAACVISIFSIVPSISLTVAGLSHLGAKRTDTKIISAPA